MESSFWIKLRSTILTAPKIQPSSAAQQTRFHKCWTTVQNGFSTPEKRSLYVQQTEIPARLKNMVDLLVDEESRLDDAGETGVCMEYLLKHNVLAKLVNNAEGDQPRGIMGETIRTIASMINLLDDRFLVHNAVHKPTVKLLRTCASSTELQSESYHEDLVDLMYIICSKIHGYPELLNIFFHDKQWLTVPQRVAARRIQKTLETMEMLKTLKASVSEGSSNKEAQPQSQDEPSSVQDSQAQDDSASEAAPSADSQNIPQEPPAPKSDYEFLLFTYLSRFVHREGKTGDFARTGLLFVMELATGSLGEYIVESDFTSLLSAGVGASYSQLPRKLLVRGGPSMINSMVGTLNDRAPPAESAPSRRANIELSTSTDFQSRLDAFLKLLEFCQDIVVRCPNSEIVKSLLFTFKAVFLENILFPSIMECSDTDGSSVAVISYIDLILQVLEHEALVDLVLGFLMSSEDDDNRTKAPQDTDDAFAEVQNSQTTSSYFTASGRFTLKDLILSRLKSRSQPTVIATLKLLSTLITRHCKYSLKLLSIQPDTRSSPFRDLNSQDGDLPLINHHVHELDLFYALISTINPNNTAEIFCNGYESYLRDAEGSVETHQCFLRRKEIDGTKATPGQLSALERKKQRRRSMKYGQKMDLPDDLSGEAFIKEQENNSEASKCCDKPGSHVVVMHHLLPSDPLLQSLLRILSHFFAHSVELNLALTGVITSLAICPYRSLEGWLLFKSSDAKILDENAPVAGALADSKVDARFELGDSDDEDTLPSYLTKANNSKQSKAAAPGDSVATPTDEFSVANPFKTFPPFFTMLRTLTQQVDYYRSEIDDFDDYLADRRRILLVATELNSAIHTPGLAGSYPPQQYSQYRQKQQYQQQQHPSGAYGSSESFVNKPAGGVRSGPGASGLPSNPPALTPRTSSLPPEGAQPMPFATRPRKSSSPTSLMSSPSNMSFLDPSGARKPLSKLSGLGAGSDSQGAISPTSPTSTHSSRTVLSGTTASSATTSSAYAASTGPRSALAAGAQAPSWGSFSVRPNPVPNPMLLKTMETMMVKPLFPDGFVNDSDSEAEAEAELELSEDESTESATEDGAQKSKKSGRRARNVSLSSTGEQVETPQQSGTQREKLVTLGQLLTNVVILEEVVKEVVAVAQVRRGLGVDKVAFL
ncbi:hypothetical protein BGZ80_006299 [Entomortierella chlamydospora]|uniref:FHF complex subunit HOOK-interacting protein C-terminal domain-containing protein n=1 Tax=Entomortierella chlamydospora TaxID=101097 RepID=A0A9P6T1V5_9FUNG|nr:hypothetical protein BGZ80_006299 [Entomortierella chlamydospora]